jgi:predicted transcriptional regulator
MNKSGMNGTEIAKELGISKQAVSFAIKKSMNKMYYEVQRQGYSERPFDTAITLMEMLKVNNGSVKDIKEFISLFSKDIQKEIQLDAVMHFNIRYTPISKYSS